MRDALHKFFITVLLSSLILLPRILSGGEAPPEVQPPTQAESSAGEDLGYGVGSVLASILYSPLKITYAGLGLITGGVGFVLSGGNPDAANSIIFPAVKGNYVITPSHLKGAEPVIFIGPTPPNNSYPQVTPPPIAAPSP